jgi:hypothetical protein
VRKAKSNEKKKRETKEEKQVRLARQAKAQTELLERMSSAVRNELRQQRKAIELLQGSGDEEASTSNGGGSGEEGWDHLGEALWWHSSSKTTLRAWDLLVTNHCSRNHI